MSRAAQTKALVCDTLDRRLQKNSLSGTSDWQARYAKFFKRRAKRKLFPRILCLHNVEIFEFKDLDWFFNIMGLGK